VIFANNSRKSNLEFLAAVSPTYDIYLSFRPPIHRDRQQKATLFYTKLMLIYVTQNLSVDKNGIEPTILTHIPCLLNPVLWNRPEVCSILYASIDSTLFRRMPCVKQNTCQKSFLFHANVIFLFPLCLRIFFTNL
jgi:hypothetical protein